MKTAAAKTARKMLDESFVKDLMDATRDHPQWLATVRFGLNQLLENPKLLIVLIATESERQAAREGGSAATNVAKILDELNLKFVVNTEEFL